MFDENFENIIFQNFEENILDKESQYFNIQFFYDLDKSFYDQSFNFNNIKKEFTQVEFEDLNFEANFETSVFDIKNQKLIGII